MLKGFPTSNLLNPVLSGEPVLNSGLLNKVALVGFASKGPLNTPIKIQNTSQLNNIMGFSSESYMLYAAEQYLTIGGGEVIAYRVANQTKTAMMSVPGVNTNIHFAKEPYIFKTNQFLRWKLNGKLSAKTLVVLATEDEGISAKQLANELNDQLTPKDYIKFYVNDGCIAANKTIELISVQNDPWNSEGTSFLDTDTDVSLTLTADSPGTEGNKIKVVIINDNDTFSFNVFYDGVKVESWSQLTKDTKSKFYVESFINLVSDWIKVIDNRDNSTLPKDGSYSLKDGSDGELDEDLLVNGINVFANKDLDIDFIAAPGYSSSEVVEALIGVSESRGDCLAVIDPPRECEIIKWAKEYKSDSAVVFWPWVKVRDGYNRRDVWVPPSGAAATAIVRADYLSAPWLSAIGASRGVIPGVLEVFEEVDRETLKKCNINPICNYLGSFAICGQKTLSGDDINVKRMMFYIEKRIRYFIDNGTLNDFRRRFVEVGEYVLDLVKNGRGIHNYTIQVDDESCARIGVQPKETSEMIYMNFRRDGHKLISDLKRRII
jgi:hypothetical protein